ncbi:non-canonical purine NTP pyrophosphatase [Patescibacteria group bacterium]|nr:MAG: non-canonical purine NTP pyrophosphatase [Patescibacteria group bacterium]
MARITLVTGNPDKKKEFENALSGTDIVIADHHLHEIQSLNLREIVEHKVRGAYGCVKGPVIVEDVSFEVAAMNGFPGPFVKYWANLVGYEKALILCEAEKNWAARAVCADAYFDGKQLVYVEEAVPGRLTSRAGDDGFGFDFFFIPDGYDQTFAQLGRTVKNKISHRARSLQALRVALAEKGILA